jgi:hypothetical protein
MNDAPTAVETTEGALAGSALARNRMIRVRRSESDGVLRDQQTLKRTTLGHGHLLLMEWR